MLRSAWRHSRLTVSGFVVAAWKPRAMAGSFPRGAQGNTGNMRAA